MPIRPYSTPPWMQILAQSSDSTNKAFDSIYRSMEDKRKSERELEQFKIATMESAYKMKQEDRRLDLSERTLNHSILESDRRYIVDLANIKLKGENDSFLRGAKRAELITNSIIAPLEKEVENLEISPWEDQEVAKQKREKLNKAREEVMSIVGGLTMDDSNLGVENKDEMVGYVLNKASNAALDIYGPLNRDTILPNGSNQPLIIPGSGPQGISPIQLFPQQEDKSSSIFGPQLDNKNKVDDVSDFAPDNENEFGTVEENGTFNFGGNAPFTIAPSSPPVKVGDMNYNSPGQKDDVSFSLEDKEKPNPDKINSIHKEAERFLNLATSKGKGDPAYQAKLSAWVDSQVGPENNKFRQTARDNLINAARLENPTADILNAAFKDASIYLGSATASSLFTEEMIKAKTERNNIESEQAKRKAEEARKEKEGTTPEKAQALVDQMNSIKSLLNVGENDVSSLSPEVRGRLQSTYDKLSSMHTDLVEQMANELVQPSDPRDYYIAQSKNLVSDLAFAGFPGYDLKSIKDPSVRGVGLSVFNIVSPHVGKKAMEIFNKEESSVTDFGKSLFNTIRSEGKGFITEDDYRHFNFTDISDRNILGKDANWFSSKLQSGLRSKYEEEWNNLSKEQKEKFANNPAVKDRMRKGNVSFGFPTSGSLGMASSQSKSVKDVFIESKISKLGFDQKKISDFYHSAAQKRRNMAERELEAF